MSQEVHEQLSIVDQLFAELKRTYYAGQRPSYAQLKLIAPTLSLDDYKLLVQRFMDYMREQEVQTFKEQEHQLSQAYPYMPDHVTEDLLFFEQTVFSQFARFLVQRDQSIAAAVAQDMEQQRKQLMFLTSENSLLKRENRKLQVQITALETSLSRLDESYQFECKAHQQAQIELNKLRESEGAGHLFVKLLKQHLDSPEIANISKSLSHSTAEALIALLRKSDGESKQQSSNSSESAQLAVSQAQVEYEALIDSSVHDNTKKDSKVSDANLAESESLFYANPSLAAASLHEDNELENSLELPTPELNSESPALRLGQSFKGMSGAEQPEFLSHEDYRKNLFMSSELAKYRHIKVDDLVSLQHGAPAFTPNVPADVAVAPQLTQGLSSLPSPALKTSANHQAPESRLPDSLLLSQGTANTQLNGLEESGAELSELEEEDVAVDPVVVEEVRPIAPEEVENDSSEVKDSEQLNALNDAAQRLAQMAAPQSATNSEESIKAALAAIISNEPLVDEDDVVEDEATSIGAQALLKRKRQVEPTANNSAVTPAAPTPVSTGTAATAAAAPASVDASVTTPSGDSVGMPLSPVQQSQTAAAETVDNAITSINHNQPTLGGVDAGVLPAGMAGLVGASFSNYPDLAALNQNLAQGKSPAQLLASLGTSSLAGWGMMPHMPPSAHAGVSSQPAAAQGAPHDLSNPLELKIDELTALRDQLFADKDNEDVTSMEIEELVLAAREQKLFTPEQEGMCRRLVVKLMFLGRDAVYPQDATASVEEILRAIPNVEQRFFAQAALAWKEQTAFDTVLPQESAPHELASTTEPQSVVIEPVAAEDKKTEAQALDHKSSADNETEDATELSATAESESETEPEPQSEDTLVPSFENAEIEQAISDNGEDSEDGEDISDFADIVETKTSPAGFLSDIPVSSNNEAEDSGESAADSEAEVVTEADIAHETEESQEATQHNDDTELQDESDEASSEGNYSGGLVFSMLSDDEDEPSEQQKLAPHGEILTFTMESADDEPDDAEQPESTESEQAESNTFRLEEDQPEQEEILSFEKETGLDSGVKETEELADQPEHSDQPDQFEQSEQSETETEQSKTETATEQSGEASLNVSAPAPHSLPTSADLSISSAPDMAAFMAMLQQPAAIEPSKSSASIPTPVVPKSNPVADLVNSLKPNIAETQVESATTTTTTSEPTEPTQVQSFEVGAVENTAALEAVTQDQARMWLTAAGLVKEDTSEQANTAASLAEIIKSGAPDTPSISSETSASLANTAISATPQPAVPIDIMGSDQQFAEELASEMVPVEQAQELGVGIESSECDTSATTTTAANQTEGADAGAVSEAATEQAIAETTSSEAGVNAPASVETAADDKTAQSAAGGDIALKSECLDTGALATEAEPKSFSASFPPAKLINSIPRSLVRDESTLVKEISSPSGDDSIAAFAAATAKVESLAPLLNEAKRESAEAADSIDGMSSHSSVTSGGVSQQEVLATSELAQVAQDVLKVASELDAKSQQAKAQSSIFDRYYGDIDLEKAKQQAQEYQDKEGDDFVSGNIRSEDEHQPAHLSTDLGESAMGTLPREVRPYQQEQSTIDSGSHGSISVSDADVNTSLAAAAVDKSSEHTHLGGTGGEATQASLSSSATLVPDQPNSEFKLESAAESAKPEVKSGIKWFSHEADSNSDSDNAGVERNAAHTSGDTTDVASEHLAALGKVEGLPHQTSFLSTGSGKSQDVVEHNLGAIEISHSAEQGHTQVTKHGAAEFRLSETEVSETVEPKTEKSEDGQSQADKSDLPEIAVSTASQPQAVVHTDSSAQPSAESSDFDMVTGNVSSVTESTGDASLVPDAAEATQPAKVELQESVEAGGASAKTETVQSETDQEHPAQHLTSISTENTNIIISEPAQASGVEPAAEIVSKVESTADTVITEVSGAAPEAVTEATPSVEPEVTTVIASAAQSEQAPAEDKSKTETTTTSGETANITVAAQSETKFAAAQIETSVSDSESTVTAETASSGEAATGAAEAQSHVAAEAVGAGAEVVTDTQAAAVESGETVETAASTEGGPVAEASLSETVKSEPAQSETESAQEQTKAESGETGEIAAVATDSAEVTEATETTVEGNQEDWNGSQTAARQALNANELVKFELLYSEVKATYLAKEQELKEVTARLGDSSVVTLDPKAIYLEVFNEVEHAHMDMLSPKLKAALSEQAEVDFFPAQATLVTGHNQSIAQNNVTSAQVLPSSLETVVTKVPVSPVLAAVPVATPAQDNLSQWGIPSNLKTEATTEVTKETDFQDLSAKSVDKHYPDEVTVDEEQVIAKFQSDADFKRESQEFNRELQDIAQQGAAQSGSRESQGSLNSARTSSPMGGGRVSLGSIGSNDGVDRSGGVAPDGSIQVDLGHSTFMEPRADISETPVSETQVSETQVATPAGSGAAATTVVPAATTTTTQGSHSVEPAPEKVLIVVDRNQELSLPVLNEQEEIEHVPTKISFDLEDSSLGSVATAPSSSSEPTDDGGFSLALESELSFKAQVESPKTKGPSHIKWQTRDSVSDWESGLGKNSFTFNPFSPQDQDSLGSGDSGHVKEPFTPHTSKFSFDPLGRSGAGALNGNSSFKGGHPFVSSLNASGKIGLGGASSRKADGSLEIAPSTKATSFSVSGGASGAVGAGAGSLTGVGAGVGTSLGNSSHGSGQGLGHGSSTSFGTGLVGNLGSSSNRSMITGATHQGVPTEVKLGADPKFSFSDFKGSTGFGLAANKSTERKNTRPSIKWQDHDN